MSKTKPSENMSVEQIQRIDKIRYAINFHPTDYGCAYWLESGLADWKVADRTNWMWKEMEKSQKIEAFATTTAELWMCDWDVWEQSIFRVIHWNASSIAWSHTIFIGSLDFPLSSRYSWCSDRLLVGLAAHLLVHWLPVNVVFVLESSKMKARYKLCC